MGFRKTTSAPAPFGQQGHAELELLFGGLMKLVPTQYINCVSMLSSTDSVLTKSMLSSEPIYNPFTLVPAKN
eukprot:6412729-Amphidinium_carterae.1